MHLAKGSLKGKDSLGIGQVGVLETINVVTKPCSKQGAKIWEEEESR